MAEIVVQYIIVRGDLKRVLKWSTGSLIAQACHAAVAVTHKFYSDSHTQLYLQDLDNMHKIVLEAPNEESLRKLETHLIEQQIAHVLWTEQPENIPTCLALKPYPKNQVQHMVKKFKLLKDD